MAADNHPVVTIDLTADQIANLDPEQRTQLEGAIKHAFITATKDFGPEFVMNTAGPVVRHSTPSDTVNLAATPSRSKPATKRSGAKKTAAKKSSSKKVASKRTGSKPSRSKPR
jgi:hypothetical protein